MLYRHVRVGDIATLERRPVHVHLDRHYTEIGIRSFGRGIFHKEPLSGADIGAKRVFSVKAGELILNNVFAWEGAIAVADINQEGLIGSHRFMTYAIDPDQADLYYLLYFFLSKPGLELIRRASPGSAGRNRTLGIKAFEALEIPLPSIEVQRDRARRVDAVIDGSRRGGELVDRAIRQRSDLIDAMIQQYFDLGIARGWTMRPLGTVAHVNPTPQQLDANTHVNFVPMSAVDKTIGQITQPQVRSVAELKGGYKQFRDGDVIFARITPCMQNGKAAIIGGLSTEYGYGSTEFHVVRPSDAITARWLHHIFRTASFKANAARHFTGTAGQQRVPTSFLREVLIPVPTIPEQLSTISQLESISQTRNQLTAHHIQQRLKFDALQASILNETFGSLS